MTSGRNTSNNKKGDSNYGTIVIEQDFFRSTSNASIFTKNNNSNPSISNEASAKPLLSFRQQQLSRRSLFQSFAKQKRSPASDSNASSSYFTTSYYTRDSSKRSIFYSSFNSSKRSVLYSSLTSFTNLNTFVRDGGENKEIDTLGNSGAGEASLVQTVSNMTKMCFGSGVLALPYATNEAGLIWFIIGVALITLWNIYSTDRLIKSRECMDQYLAIIEDVESKPIEYVLNDRAKELKESLIKETILEESISSDQSSDTSFRSAYMDEDDMKSFKTTNTNFNDFDYGNFEDDESTMQPLENFLNENCLELEQAKDETFSENPCVFEQTKDADDEKSACCTFGEVAFFAFGEFGLNLMDALMLSLMLGIIISYEGMCIDMAYTHFQSLCFILISSHHNVELI